MSFPVVPAKSLQSCLTLSDAMDCSLPGSSVHGILQAKYWSGLPFPSPGDLPNPGIGSVSLTSNLHWQEGSLPPAPPGKSLDTRFSRGLHLCELDWVRRQTRLGNWGWCGLWRWKLTRKCWRLKLRVNVTGKSGVCLQSSQERFIARDFPDNCQKSSISLCKNSSNGFAFSQTCRPCSGIGVLCDYSLSQVTCVLPMWPVSLGSQDHGRA